MRRSRLLAAGLSLLLQACLAEPGPLLERGTGDALSEANGRKLNGRKLNGRKLNGRKLNGRKLNGARLHGLRVVDGALQMRDELDRVVTGQSLVGVILEGTVDLVAGGTETIQLEIAAVQNGAVAGLDRRTWLYDVLLRDGATNAESPVCEGGELVTPIQGYWDETARHVTSDPDDVTLACRGFALGKCVEAGYLPHAGLADHHQACVRMLRADYCGDGQSMTVDGTMLNVWDSAGIQAQEDAVDWGFEAKWGPDGATCVSTLRYGDVVCDNKGECIESPLNYVLAFCPDKMNRRGSYDYGPGGGGWFGLSGTCMAGTGFGSPMASLVMNQSSSLLPETAGTFGPEYY